MPRDGSALNRFDRFLKERKDSELLNLMALRREMDDGGMEGAEYIKVGYEQICFIWNQLLERVVYSTVLQEIGWLSFLHCILDSFIRSRVVLGESIGYAVTCKIRETFRNGSETKQILLDWKKSWWLCQRVFSCQSFKELDEENELLRKQVQTLESTKVSVLINILHVGNGNSVSCWFIH